MLITPIKSLSFPVLASMHCNYTSRTNPNCSLLHICFHGPDPCWWMPAPSCPSLAQHNSPTANLPDFCCLLSCWLAWAIDSLTVDKNPSLNWHQDNWSVYCLPPSMCLFCLDYLFIFILWTYKHMCQSALTRSVWRWGILLRVKWSKIGQDFFFNLCIWKGWDWLPFLKPLGAHTQLKVCQPNYSAGHFTLCSLQLHWNHMSIVLANYTRHSQLNLFRV